MTEPLVTCVMPTMPSRLCYIRQAIDCFRKQAYENKELLIVADSEMDFSGIPWDDFGVARVKPGLTVGKKRNIGAEMARGEIIAHQDDDDWFMPNRITDQVATLLSTGKEVTSYTSATVREMRVVKVCEDGKWRETSGWWRLDNSNHIGGALMYRRSWWRANQFLSVNIGEDAAFVNAAADAGEFVPTPGGEHSYCIRNHHKGTCGRVVTLNDHTELPDGGVFQEIAA